MRPLKNMNPEGSEVGNVDIAIGNDEKFRQGELSFAQHAQSAGKGLARIAVGDPGGGETVEAGFAEGL